MNNRVLEFKGTHQEIGEQIGLVYKKYGKKDLFIPSIANQYYQKQLRIYEKFYPLYFEFLDGLAKGMGLNKDKAYKSCLTAFLSTSHSLVDRGCSTFAIHNEYGIFVGRNYDWRQSSEKYSKLLQYQFTDNSSFNFSGISDMGTWKVGVVVPESDFVLITEDGWNEKGLYIGLNGAPGKMSSLGMSTPHVVQLIAEKCQTANEALNILEKIPMARSQMFTLVDKRGNLVVVEKSLEKGTRIRRSDQYIIATNHFNHPDLLSENLLIFEKVPFHSTFARYYYLDLLLKIGQKKIKLGSIIPLMRKPPLLQNWRGIENGDVITIWTLALNILKGDYIVNFAPLSFYSKTISGKN